MENIRRKIPYEGNKIIVDPVISKIHSRCKILVIAPFPAKYRITPARKIMVIETITGVMTGPVQITGIEREDPMS